MQRLKIALIIPDGITRRGMVSLITQSNYANCKLYEFEDIDGFRDGVSQPHLVYFDISTLMIDIFEEQTQVILICNLIPSW